MQRMYPGRCSFAFRLTGIAYVFRLGFNASANVLMRALDATGVELTQNDLLAYLESAIEHFDTKGKPAPTIGQAEALYQLIGEDLTTVQGLLTRYREFWETPLEHRLRSTFDLIQQSMRELGRRRRGILLWR